MRKNDQRSATGGSRRPAPSGLFGAFRNGRSPTRLETGDDRRRDLLELPDLIGREPVDDVFAHCFDVPWRRRREGREAGVGQRRRLPTAIGFAIAALDPAAFLEPVDGV
jgi:hypothetical protein